MLCLGQQRSAETLLYETPTERRILFGHKREEQRLQCLTQLVRLRLRRERDEAWHNVRIHQGTYTALDSSGLESFIGIVILHVLPRLLHRRAAKSMDVVVLCAALRQVCCHGRENRHNHERMRRSKWCRSVLITVYGHLWARSVARRKKRLFGHV